MKTKLIVMLAALFFIPSTQDCFGSPKILMPNEKAYDKVLYILESNLPKLTEAISVYNKVQSYEPYLSKGDINFKFVGYDNNFIYYNGLVIALMYADLSQGNNTFKASYIIIVDIVNKNFKIKFQYLGNTTIGPILLNDMLKLMKVHPKISPLFKSAKEPKYFIEQMNNKNLQPGQKAFKFTFFKQTDDQKIISSSIDAVITPDGRGGNYFEIGDK